MLLDPEPAGSEDEDLEPPPQSVAQAPIRLEPRVPGSEPLVFKQGAHPPYGIRWYGITSLFGHLRNFTARAIATESVDSRDWMRPNRPDALVGAAARVLRDRAVSGQEGAATLVEAMGRPMWIDFVADTGDDRDVSAGVGAMLANVYEAENEDGKKVFLPRGDMLLFGGDVAYPVATADEIYKRVVEPWNEALRKIGASAKKRVVLGVPGNHDWYDGLDGFGRMFRRRADEPFRADDRDRTSKIGKRLRRRTGRKLGLAARQLHLDEVGGTYALVVGFLKSVRAFFKGQQVKRRRRLVLRGYEPVQEASYFVLPLAPGLDLYGADRQLGRVDFRQRSFFWKWRKAHPERAVLFVAGDPAWAYGYRNDPGIRMLGACRISLEKDRILYLAGDFHHYERRTVGRSMHVIAGGGGAFLHGTRIAPYPKPAGDPFVAYPDADACRKLVAQVPFRLALFRAGGLVHIAFALLASIELGAAAESQTALVVTSLVLGGLLWLGLYFVAHQGTGKKRIAAIAAPFGIGLGVLPMLFRLAMPNLPFHLSDGAILVACAFLGALVFGFYLSILAILGLEVQQAFTVLGHPGFKHFMRLCVHPDGRVEAWTIGKDDMLADGPPVVIDRFTWVPGPPDPPKASKRPPPPPAPPSSEA